MINRKISHMYKKIFFLLFILSLESVISKTIDFQFYGKNLGDLVQKIAQIKGVNVLLPSGTDKIDVTINFSTPEAIDILEAEEYLLYFLNMAGYMLTMQGEILTVVKKNENTLGRSNIPLYVQVMPENLPDNPGYIRALYFLTNLRVPSGSSGSETIKKILLDIMPDGAKGIMVDPRSNCIILTGPANSIAAAMMILLEIDQSGIKEEIAILPLHHTSVGIVSKLLEELINIAKESQLNQSQTSLSTGGALFSGQVKIIPENKSNSLILLGKGAAIEKIIMFVKTLIDVPQESGNCTIHVIPLKFLDARKLAPIIQGLVSGQSQGGQGQSVRENQSSQFRFFDNVLIFAEEITTAPPAGGQAQQGESKLTMGGNRLIVAATGSDYQVIKEIVNQLDQPQSQVIIEVMVLDLSVSESNNFSSQFRLPNMMVGDQSIGAQSIMMDTSQFIINDPALPGTALTDASNLTNQSTINSDLLSPLVTGTGNSTDISSLADNVPRNGMIISIGERFKNMGIASILQLEQGFSVRDVVANPHVITQNNTKAEIKNVQIRRGDGNLSSNSSQYGGATVVDIQPYAAALNIGITPRISKHANLDEGTNSIVNLEISIDIEDFKKTDSSSFDKFTRGVKTNSSISSGDLLVIGGLYKEVESQLISKVPILGDIPFVGAFFRKTQLQRDESNLVIIIRVTVLEESALALSQFTHEQIKFSQDLINESAFGKFKDPITHINFDRPFGINTFYPKI
jgi:general secretion pathway protein D